jgi:hypothetical protein
MRKNLRRLTMTESVKYYTKGKNGRYEFSGYNRPDLHPGLWLIQDTEHSRSYKNAFYRMADIPDLVEVEDMLKCMVLEDLVAKSIVEWADSSRGMSPSDVAKNITARIYKKLQEHRAAIKKLDEELAK